eukprot:scaffold162396_cov32-Tisochrysis_lutea.AAC.2
MEVERAGTLWHRRGRGRRASEEYGRAEAWFLLGQVGARPCEDLCSSLLFWTTKQGAAGRWTLD